MTDRRRLQAPRTHGAILAEPPLAETGRLLADNRQRFNQAGPDILGRSWPDIRRQARQDILAAAKEYLSGAGEPVPAFNGTALFLAGHQPDLFHPGVWIKNFALNGLACLHGATPLNLIVDSDVAKTLSIRAPTCLSDPAKPGNTRNDPNQVKRVTIPIDRWTREIPYEELRVADEAIFAGVEGVMDQVIQTWSFEPIFGPFWRDVMRQSRRTDILGERLASARRTFERKWNCHNLELPVSRVCQTQGFAWFACHLLAHLPRFQAVYNQSIRSYRARYGLRSQSHPVPELAVKNEWLEAPFWAWRADQARRRPLFTRVGENGIELRLENASLPTLPLDLRASQLPERVPQAVQAWQELERQGVKIRSRALITTMFARLFLGELFIHGIGGGKYDELTDEIIRDFYELEPPYYLVLSGTLQLPLPIFSARRVDCRRLARELRDLRWNPQRQWRRPPAAGVAGAGPSKPRTPGPSQGFPSFSPGHPPDVDDLIARKEAWIAQQPTCPNERRERFQKIRELTELLRPWVKEREQQIQEMLEQCESEVHANTILQDREYAFCLHSEETLRPFLTQFL